MCEDHLKHLNEVLSNSIPSMIKLPNVIGLTEILYLGLKIGAQGVSVDEEKLKAIQNWRRPSNLTQLRGFVGLCSDYRRFVRVFSQLADPLTNQLKKGAFVWTPTVQQDFDKLKEVMSSYPVLAIPDFSHPFVLECDASGK
ncbi:uncharacterized mitochondrial protein AtMg00860-like [Cryptomeria japonica]|uniref:uncharacterized mitochondrial protein AtMg00860-like n=1 Tax=Cryptomeria japonica TaxID=3369 RepID=UPI0025ACC83E|nr:uncharacterized mitochondrial protein AtMg00860-like [Cryptomeria japonica]